MLLNFAQSNDVRKTSGVSQDVSKTEELSIETGTRVRCGAEGLCEKLHDYGFEDGRRISEEGFAAN